MQLDERVRPRVVPASHVAGAHALRRTRSPRRRGVAIAVVLAVLLGLVAGLRHADGLQRAADLVRTDHPIIASPQTTLTSLWRVYKDTYLEAGTHRTMDLQNGGITTSEGESYTMLRAVWMDDQQTFAQSWQWTKDNLQRNDHLMAWKFGERPDGSYGIQEQVGGANSATDADADIAFALLMAYSRWKQDLYLYDALPIIRSVWEQSVVYVGLKPVLVADDLERSNLRKVVVNPSYFAPYAYRVFARVDPGHDWLGLVDNGYALLEQLDRQPLDAGSAVGLPPDWVSLDRRTGEFSAPLGSQSTRFSYDALRLPWRLALDNTWYGERRARELLERESVLAQTWSSEHRLVASYHRDGTPAADYEGVAMYGGAMGYFEVVRPDLAREVYARKLLPLYDLDAEDLAKPLGYYDSNWMWFGMALYLHQLPNLNVTQE